MHVSKMGIYLLRQRFCHFCDLTNPKEKRFLLSQRFCALTNPKQQRFLLSQSFQIICWTKDYWTKDNILIYLLNQRLHNLTNPKQKRFWLRPPYLSRFVMLIWKYGWNQQIYLSLPTSAFVFRFLVVSPCVYLHLSVCLPNYLLRAHHTS